MKETTLTPAEVAAEPSDRRDYFHKLAQLMDVLRSPGGCPWDREQTRESLKPMLIEEAYEVLEALDGEDPEELLEELGDLLFQVIFHSRISKEREEFDVYDVCRAVYQKMVRRHPHVFAEEHFEDSQELLRNWEDLKSAEKAAAGRENRKKSLLDGIPPELPTLYRTHQITAKAARVGFDWESLEGIRQKWEEEFEELTAARQANKRSAVQEEVGDLLFTALNVARFLEIDPETALRRANRKFENRFRSMEKYFEEQGRPLKEVPVEEMEEQWNRGKQEPEAEGTAS